MTVTTLVILLLVVSAVAVMVLLLRNASRGRRLNQDIPPAMRPAYSDDQLETTVLERTMQWGLILTVAFAIFLPMYWYNEPNRQTSVQEAAFIHDFEQGEQLFTDFCSQCHGADASGGGATSTYDPEDSWPAPNLRTIVARYDGTPVTDIQDYVETTIKRGRPGTPMPAWGAQFGGPMTDHQVDRIARWILANQDAQVDEASPAVGMTGEELFNNNCVRCHGDEGQGFIGPSLVGVFERHNERTVLGILQNGIYLANGISMPPWQEGYMYPESRFTDSALRRIIGYLHELQPTDVPEDAQGYATPYQGGPRPDTVEGGESPSGETGGSGGATDEEEGTGGTDTEGLNPTDTTDTTAPADA